METLTYLSLKKPLPEQSWIEMPMVELIGV